MSQKQNVTIKDVAREAGVSVATVSYVINDRRDIRISEETRKKVLQVIHLLNYSPNRSAKALATQRKNLLAFSYSKSDFSLQKTSQMEVIEFLSGYFHAKDIELILLDAEHPEKCDQADAIICYDISSEAFYRLGDENFIPMVALDCMINNPLFYQVNTDPDIVKERAAAYFGGKEYLFVTFSTKNQEKERYLYNAFPNHFFISETEALFDIREENILTFDSSIADILKAEHRVLQLPSITVEKADVLFHCIESAMDRTNQASEYHMLV